MSICTKYDDSNINTFDHVLKSSFSKLNSTAKPVETQTLKFQKAENFSIIDRFKECILKVPNAKILGDTSDSKEICSTEFIKKFNSEFDATYSSGTTGFYNEGNNCYLNSVLQCLFANGSFISFIVHHLKSKTCHKSANHKYCLICSIANLHLNYRNRDCISPRDIMNHIKSICPTFRFGSQEDAHEFLISVLSKMEDIEIEIYDRLRRNIPIHIPSFGKNKVPFDIQMTNSLRKIFGGEFIYRIKCLACKTVSSSKENFFNVTLDINQCANLSQSFSRLVAIERLRGSNMYKCEKCKTLQESERRCMIKRPPQNLIIQLNRFRGIYQKLSSYIAYSHGLDITNFVDIASNSSNQRKSFKYSLYGTVEHHGMSCKSGHYTAYSKRQNKWFKHDDSYCCAVNENAVTSGNAYLLFYRLQENPNPLDQVNGKKRAPPIVTEIPAKIQKSESKPQEKIKISFAKYMASNSNSSDKASKTSTETRPSSSESPPNGLAMLRKEYEDSSDSQSEEAKEEKPSAPYLLEKTQTIQKNNHKLILKNFIAQKLKKNNPNNHLQNYRAKLLNHAKF